MSGFESDVRELDATEIDAISGAEGDLKEAMLLGAGLGGTIGGIAAGPVGIGVGGGIGLLVGAALYYMP